MKTGSFLRNMIYKCYDFIEVIDGMLNKLDVTGGFLVTRLNVEILFIVVIKNWQII